MVSAGVKEDVAVHVAVQVAEGVKLAVNVWVKAGVFVKVSEAVIEMNGLGVPVNVGV